MLGDPIGKPTFYALMLVHAALYYTDTFVMKLDPLDSGVVRARPRPHAHPYLFSIHSPFTACRALRTHYAGRARRGL